MNFLILFCISIFLSLDVYAFEVDNFTNRYSPLKDSRDVMNAEVNKRLQKAAESANGLLDRAVNRVTKGANKCDKDDLYEGVKDEVGGWVIGSLESFAEDSDNIQKHEDGKKGIYYRDGVAMVGAGPILKIFGTHSSINLNGHYIGTDKFGHFFDQGYEYLKEFRKENKYTTGITRALKYGRDLEEGKYGMSSTGVFSNADLVANYSGLQFWLALTDGANPYFKCVQGQWKMERSFDFAQYVNSGWDEAINCSKFRKTTKDGVERNAEALEKNAKKKGKNETYLCPVSSDQCKKIANLYKNNASYLVSAECLYGPPQNDKGVRYNGQTPFTNVGGSQQKTSTSSQQKGAR